jgi:hypothetical protein
MASPTPAELRVERTAERSYRILVIILGACLVCLLLIASGVLVAIHQRDAALQKERDAQLALEKTKMQNAEDLATRQAMSATIEAFKAKGSLYAVVTDLCDQHKYQSARDVVSYMLKHHQIDANGVLGFPPACQPANADIKWQ